MVSGCPEIRSWQLAARLGARLMGAVMAWCVSAAGDVLSQAEVENRYYRLETYVHPPELTLEISGLATLPDGRLAIAIRKGEIWIAENLEDPAGVDYRQFATGLHEPLGLAWHDGALYTVQRTELTRLRDRNGDGAADDYQAVAKGWGVTGAYHEYAYGPVFDPQGNAWLTLNSSMGPTLEPFDNAWRGWSLRVTPDGRWQPVSGGFRSPSGLGINAEGDVFATDQQGNWFATCPLIHVRPGVFHGHPAALQDCHRPEATFQLEPELPEGMTVVEAAAEIGAYELPAVWFPYRKMGMSSTDVLCDMTGGRFGPFAGQLFVGEFTMSFVSRVFLEKVGGQYQGACFRFREGLQCAALRLAWGNDGSLWIGQSNRGWNSLGTRSYGLQRLRFTGEMPFEMRTLSASPDGFLLRFTQTVDVQSAGDPDSYSMTSYTYPYHSAYGGPEIDVREPRVVEAVVGNDGISVDLKVDGLRAGYVHELDAAGVRSKDGRPLLHRQAYYTLNRIPEFLNGLLE